jgi:hypothetical protein
MCKTWGRIRMRIGIVLMSIRIRIWIGINIRNSDQDPEIGIKTIRSTTLHFRYQRFKELYYENMRNPALVVYSDPSVLFFIFFDFYM